MDAIQPEAHVYLNPDDAERLGVASGDFVRVTVGRGSVELRALLSHRDTPGTCFLPFHFREAAANVLTIDEVDPREDPRVQVLRRAHSVSGSTEAAAKHESATVREGA